MYILPQFKKKQMTQGDFDTIDLESTLKNSGN